jgi:hypothetical protein
MSAFLPPSSDTASSRKMRSVEASRAIWNCSVDFSRTELLVLQALASFANAEFECFPSVKRLASMTRLSERQTIRVIHKLRDKGAIAFDDNRGGHRKCNNYRLLVPLNADPRSTDTTNSDMSNHDIRQSETLTFQKQTMPYGASKSDTMMSDEWLEGFSEWLTQWKNLRDIGDREIRSVGEALCDVYDVDCEQLLNAVQQGVPVERIERCDKHGSFIRRGYRLEHWIAWEGKENHYGGWSVDSGCPGCKKQILELQSSSASHQVRAFFEPKRMFELRTPVKCESHGNFIFYSILSERLTEEQDSNERHTWITLGDLCPECEAEHMWAIKKARDSA